MTAQLNTASAVAEEYKLDERELAALERLYDYPARSSLTASSRSRAASSVESGSLESRSLNDLAPTSSASASSLSLTMRRRTLKRRGQSTSRGEQHTRARDSSSAAVGDNMPLTQQEVIARLLEEAARSPPPPIPSRRPDVASLNIRQSSTETLSKFPTTQTLRSRLPPPPPAFLSTADPPAKGQHQSQFSESATPATSTPVRESVSAGTRPHQRQCSLEGLFTNVRSPSSPSSTSFQHSRSTPDWISNIFHLAKTGDTNALAAAISGMQAAMVRNLADHHGNNVTHVLCAGGHVETLSWLCSHLAPDIQPALFDRNQHSLTPSLAAIRFGRLPMLEWLVENTPVGELMFVREGQRSLLHLSAKYDQMELVSWCCDKLSLQKLSLDPIDHRHETPLHLAAKSGNLSIVQELLTRGAAVTARNDMGLKSYDLAVHFGHVTCANVLLAHEAFTELAVDFASLQCETVRVQQENNEYKNNFREVLSVGRKLLREREEMCRELGRLHDATLQLNDKLLQRIQQLSAENEQLRQQRSPPSSSSVSHDHLRSSAADSSDWPEEMSTALNTRWHHCQRSWFSTQLAEAQHRLLQAEQVWQRLRAARKQENNSAPAGCSTIAVAAEIVSNKLADLRAQSINSNLSDMRRVSSSNNSLVDSELYQQIAPKSVCSERQRTAHTENAIYGHRSQELRTMGNTQRQVVAHRQFETPSRNLSMCSSQQNTSLMKLGSITGSSHRVSMLRRSTNLLDRLSVSTRDPASTNLSSATHLSKSTGRLENSTMQRNLAAHSETKNSDSAALHSTSLDNIVDYKPGRQNSGMSQVSTGLQNAALAHTMSNGLLLAPNGRFEAAEDSNMAASEQMHALSLVSENGEASVLEVIEPSAAEAAEVSASELVQLEIEQQLKTQPWCRESSGISPVAAQIHIDQLPTANPPFSGSGVSTENGSSSDRNDFLGHRSNKPHRLKAISRSECDVSRNPDSRGRQSEGGLDAARNNTSKVASTETRVLCEPDLLQGTRVHDVRTENGSSPKPSTLNSTFGNESVKFAELDEVKSSCETGPPGNYSSSSFSTEIYQNRRETEQGHAVTDGGKLAPGVGVTKQADNSTECSVTTAVIEESTPNTISTDFDDVSSQGRPLPSPSRPQHQTVGHPRINHSPNIRQMLAASESSNTPRTSREKHDICRNGQITPQVLECFHSEMSQVSEQLCHSNDDVSRSLKPTTTAPGLNTVTLMPLKGETSRDRPLRRIERPWYEVSDDDSEPARLYETV